MEEHTPDTIPDTIDAEAHTAEVVESPREPTHDARAFIELAARVAKIEAFLGLKG